MLFASLLTLSSSCHLVPRLGGVHQVTVVLEGELGVHGEIDLLVGLPRHDDGEVHRLLRTRREAELHLVLLRAQDLLEEALQSDFSPVASLFDVGEDAVEVAHLCSELLHLAETFLHAFQPVADLLERGLHPLFQGLGELLVHGGTHPFELFLVVIAHLFQLRLHLAAHTVHVDGELLAHLGKLRLQVRAHFDDPRLEVGLQRLEIL